MGIFSRLGEAGKNAATRAEMQMDKARSVDRTSEDSKEKGAFRAGAIIEGNDLIVDFTGRKEGDAKRIDTAKQAAVQQEESSSKYFDASSREARIADALASLSGGKDVKPATAEELSQLADDLENADDVNFRALQLDALRKAAEKQRAQDEQYAERGKKPDRSYDHEKGLRDESEALQQEALAYAAEVVSLFPENPEDITEDILRQAGSLARRFSVREGDSLRKLQKLKDSMKERFPDQAAEYDQKFADLLTQYGKVKETVDAAINKANEQTLEGDAQREAVSGVVDRMGVLNKIDLSAEDINISLVEGGITIDAESGQITIEAGSPAEKFIQQQAKIDFLIQVYDKTVKVAETQPEVADRLIVLAKTIQAEKNILRTLEANLKTSVMDKAEEKQKLNIARRAEEKQKAEDAEKAQAVIDKKSAEDEAKRVKREQRLNWRVGIVRSVANFFNNLADGAEKAGLGKLSKAEAEAAVAESKAKGAQQEIIEDSSGKLAQLEADLREGSLTADQLRRLLAQAEAEE